MYYAFRAYDLWRGKLRLILGLTVLTTLVAGVWSSPLISPPQYAASIRAFSASPENYAPIYNSGLLRDSLIRTFDLPAHYGIDRSEPDWYEQTAERLDENFLMEVSPKKNTVRLTVFDRNREQARAMLEEAARLGKEMSGSIVEQTLTNISETRELQLQALEANIGKSLEQKEAELAEAEAAYARAPNNAALQLRLERVSDKVAALEELKERAMLGKNLPRAPGAAAPFNQSLEYLTLDREALGQFVEYWNLRRPVVFILGGVAVSNKPARPRIWLTVLAAAGAAFCAFSFFFVFRSIVIDQWTEYVRYDRPQKEKQAPRAENGEPNA